MSFEEESSEKAFKRGFFQPKKLNFFFAIFFFCLNPFMHKKQWIQSQFWEKRTWWNILLNNKLDFLFLDIFRFACQRERQSKKENWDGCKREKIFKEREGQKKGVKVKWVWQRKKKEKRDKERDGERVRRLEEKVKREYKREKRQIERERERKKEERDSVWDIKKEEKEREREKRERWTERIKGWKRKQYLIETRIWLFLNIHDQSRFVFQHLETDLWTMQYSGKA